VSRRLGSDGDLSTRQAAATIRLAIGNVPQIWKDGHVSLGALWRLYSQYPYMPRLRDRRVLADGIVDMPLLWQTDAFALATGFDEAAGRYIGLWTPEDNGAAPAATDSLLLVRPDVAAKQREAEVAATPGTTQSPTAEKAKRYFEPDPDHPGVYNRKFKTRFYAVKTLNSDKIALDFKNIADEILAHLREDGTDLIVRIEIEANKPVGFEEDQVRTLSENARTLKFDQSGFEES
jgi:hypothetical protein